MQQTAREAEWRRWVENHAPKLLLFARQKARSDTDAQDLVQDAVLECWERQRDDEPPALPLVFATIRRRAIDQARRENRRVSRELAAAVSDEEWFDFSVETRELNQLVQNSMNRLPDIYREVITLKIWGELTFAEIAQALDIPANTAASRYRYALTELKKLMKGVLA